MPNASLKHCTEVSFETISKTPPREKANLYFQIIYIVSGTGFLELNGNQIRYGTGSLYLITPNDKHRFGPDQKTEQLVVRFNNDYIREYRWKTIDHVESLLYHSSHLTGCMMKNSADRFLIERIIESMIHTMKTEGQYTVDLLFHLVNSLVVIAARNIAQIKPQNLPSGAETKIQEIITYIQSNINDPEKLKASNLSKEFGISETYLGSYFKNRSGETLQHFIANYKLRLIEHRLKLSDMRINEIATEFGFTDESHLNKFFKKLRGMSLSEFRKKKAHPTKAVA
ncbi:AraC family transcriptional regulator [Pseudoflavitalea sp. G-6-1-2]|uniref:AraC family transcriptional regulator n=1 Tax=Pseudoflavitalea sp. G-6-1-2 TaxID=2728841 RepID=UPI00146A6FFB|nr:helix-turn-helix domain-containing protein [Pseudoflavitalea sp. G-6-1-2]NML22609.1 AraC family transcriptional regulator [Pseudoflavitalea sp. G-6-1-2]